MNSKRLTAIFFLLFILAGAGLTVGCSDNPAGSGVDDPVSNDRNPAFVVSTTDMKGREIRLTEPVERAVVLTAADCEIIYALGAGEVVVGRGAYCDYPEAALAVTQVQSGRESNIEQIIALNPQVVFMGTMDQTEEQISALEAAGVTVVISDAADIAGVYEAIAMIGSVLNKESEAAALAQEMQDSLAAIAAKAAAQAAPQEKTIYFEVSPLEWGLWAAGTDTFMDEIATMLGLSNIFADISGWHEVSQEQIISRSPDYIVTITMYFDDGPRPEDEITARAGWQAISAVQNSKVFYADSDEISRPGPRLVTAAEELYGLIYEE